MKEEKWYKEELLKLLHILQQESTLMGRSYMIEKVSMIYKEQGIILHPILQSNVDKCLGKKL